VSLNESIDSEVAIDMSIAGLSKAYAKGSLTPNTLIAYLRERCEQFQHHNIWIKLLSDEELLPYINSLSNKEPATTPLWGVPFAIKDNIDLAGIDTTAACEAFRNTPAESATVVGKLLDAGAIPVGKTNLDQFATGLNGTRSPWGPCGNSFNTDYVSGGSSSGSAVSVALGLCSFSLGTDTAGSGRVPAGFNNLVGLKPSKGLLSTTGVVPACKSLDCVSIFTYNTDDANVVLTVAEGEDKTDDFSRANTFNNFAREYGCRLGHLRVAVLNADDLQFFGDQQYAEAYQNTINSLAKNGFELTEIDYKPFDEVAKLLYEGPWVSERFIATSPLISDNPSAINDTVRTIVGPGGEKLATDLFKSEYRLSRLKKECLSQLEGFDCLLTPTAGCHFTIAQMHENPIVHNSELGYYTNFVNLLDMAAVAVPCSMTASDMPFGITLVANAFKDRALLSIANRIQQLFPLTMGATGIEQPKLNTNEVFDCLNIDIVVCGAHLHGQPLNWQLVERGAVFKEKTTTTSEYCLYQLPGDNPRRPALVKSDTDGCEIEVEIWSMPTEALGGFVAKIPAPLGIGKVNIADGRELCGFICADGAVGNDCQNISEYGGWRAYLDSR
jgi:allophanate hydrolase